jgi:DNA-binding transcriptional regulator YiaG
MKFFLKFFFTTPRNRIRMMGDWSSRRRPRAPGVKIMPVHIKKAKTRKEESPARKPFALPENKPTPRVPRNSDLVTATRKQLGVTQEILARLIGVSQRAVSGWESGRSINPKFQTVFRRKSFGHQQLTSISTRKCSH